MPQTNREIGGYIELDDFPGPEYHPDALALNCARNCFLYVAEARCIKHVWVPSYMCISIKNAALKAGLEVLGYPIAPDFMPDFSAIDLGSEDWLYVVDFYGQLTIDQIRECARRAQGRIIADESHNFFRRRIDGIDSLNCCRKYFGVPDGGYLYTDLELDRYLETDKSADRMAHILGRYEGTASEFYAVASANDCIFGKQDIKHMSRLTRNLLRAEDYDHVKTRREENFGYLSERLSGLNELSPIASEGPYMYPLLIENAVPIRKAMQRRKVYVPTLWPHSLDAQGIGGRYSRDILPLPVDQRYCVDDMAYVCDMVEELVKK